MSQNWTFVQVARPISGRQEGVERSDSIAGFEYTRLRSCHIVGVLVLILKVVVFGVGDRRCLVFAHDREWVRLQEMVSLIVSAG
ncbi:hypothetical protein VIGAN_11164700 [Vigna angularis var. angularis]|uniref:Uncharacterized protein n=1 Tax=Vigna angularis var. angularis TaxID=157739 RepID=A0A0S3TAY4_PHAAN|nr:hypothetical protein VIGAN_11164700 [Vigna angularis var. angularis]